MTNRKLASVIVVLVAVAAIFLPLLPFKTVLIAAYAVGALMSGAFVFTWFPLALRALRHHRRDVSLLRIIDYAGLQLVVFLAFLLILRTLLVYGVAPPQDGLAAVSRVLLPFMLDVIIALRLWKWGVRLWESRHQYGGPSDVLPEPPKVVDER